jgi:hypothetical protein
MMKKVADGKVTLENLIVSEEYYLTNLDIWALSSLLKLPILLFSSKPIRNLFVNAKWCLLAGDKNTQKYFFIRSPVDTGIVPEYNLIIPTYKLEELNGFFETMNNQEFIENNISFEMYLQQYIV